MSTLNRVRDRGADGRIMRSRRPRRTHTSNQKRSFKLQLTRMLRQGNKAACRTCLRVLDAESVEFTDRIQLPIWFW